MDQNEVFEKLKEIFVCTPVKVTQDCFQKIPTEPGVYWYVRGDEEILYIGDSKNLKKRIKEETSIRFDFEGSKANTKTLGSTNIRLRELIFGNSEYPDIQLYYITPSNNDVAPQCEILYDKQVGVSFKFGSVELEFKTSLYKLGCIAPKQRLELQRGKESSMSLERVLLMVYWINLY